MSDTTVARNRNRIYANDGRVILAKSVRFIENKIDSTNTNKNLDGRELVEKTKEQTQPKDSNEIAIDLIINKLSSPFALQQQQTPQFRRSEGPNYRCTTGQVCLCSPI